MALKETKQVIKVDVFYSEFAHFQFLSLNFVIRLLSKSEMQQAK